MKTKIKSRGSSLITGLICILFYACSTEKESVPETEEINEKNAEYELLKQQGYSIEKPYVLNFGLNPGEFVKWIKDPANGHYKETKIEELTFSVLHKPADYIICLEQKSEDITLGLEENRKKQLEGLEQYEIKIDLGQGQQELLKYGLNSIKEYEDRVKYFAFNMQKDIHMLTEKGDTIPCVLFHFERTYDVVPYCKFLVGFRPTETKQKTIVLTDKIFKKGKLQFLFFQKDLMTQPLLKTSL